MGADRYWEERNKREMGVCTVCDKVHGCTKKLEEQMEKILAAKPTTGEYVLKWVKKS